jgi:hypothetical protein
MVIAIGAGRITSGATAVVFETMLEIPAQLGTSSAVLIANQYVVAGERPVTVTLCVEPDADGAGTPVDQRVADEKFAAVIADVE